MILATKNARPINIKRAPDVPLAQSLPGLSRASERMFPQTGMFCVGIHSPVTCIYYVCFSVMGDDHLIKSPHDARKDRLGFGVVIVIVRIFIDETEPETGQVIQLGFPADPGFAFGGLHIPDPAVPVLSRAGANLPALAGGIAAVQAIANRRWWLSVRIRLSSPITGTPA